MNTSKFFGPTFSLICFAITGCILLAEAEQEITTPAPWEPTAVVHNGKVWRVLYSHDRLGTNVYASFAGAEEVLENWRAENIPGHWSNGWVVVDAVNPTNSTANRLHIGNELVVIPPVFTNLPDATVFFEPGAPKKARARVNLEPMLPPMPPLPSPLAAKERALELGNQSRAKFTPSHE